MLYRHNDLWQSIQSTYTTMMNHMTYFESPDPTCDRAHCPQSVVMEIIPRTVDLGGFNVRRVLPSTEKRTVGPFVFWDQAGPGEFLTGKGLDVRPHPHICLSTMTYLFSGRLEHRDTLGSHQIIEPGAINFMTAGRGIAHSERTPQADRSESHPLFGIQSWLALPINKEEMAPSFTHYDQSTIPTFTESGIRIHLAAGEWRGEKSPVITHTDGLFMECHLDAGAELFIPATHDERALHLLSGQITIDNTPYTSGHMLILKPGMEIKIKSGITSHAIILGGSPLEEPRFLWWNFVASSKERIEQAKMDWQQGKFGKIPGDDKEFIPLPV